MTVYLSSRRAINVISVASILAITAAPLRIVAQSSTPVTAAASMAPAPASQPSEVSSPKPFSRLSSSVHSLRDSIVALARLQLGVKYRRGASSPERGFDCSGLVKYVLAHFGTEMPRTSKEQALLGERIERNVAALKPGDLLTFGKGSRVSHIAIYIGDGKYVHAPKPGARVKVETLANTSGSWWKGARRLFSFDDSTTAN